MMKSNVGAAALSDVEGRLLCPNTSWPTSRFRIREEPHEIGPGAMAELLPGSSK